ncbi:MAG: hypothetical protein QOE70_5623 [Chthoniobacter sp.]|jgi:hypothetical protein|nr:hypothetical protein [Chthoniobacter sp.]
MPELDPAGHERRDISARAVMWFAISLVAALIVIFVGTRIFEGVLARTDHADATAMAAPRVEPPPPRLQTDPVADLATFRAAEEARLHTYGWIDRNAGLIHVPIERAMDLIAERGLPVRPQPKGATP